MSVRYRLIRAVAKRMGFKKLFQLPRAELVAKAREMNQKRQFQLPKSGKYNCADEVILGQYHCLRFFTQPRPAQRALLFLFGGGMLIGPDGMDWDVANEMGKESGRDVWFPYYPLCTDHSISESYDMVFETYRKMVEIYGGENIAVVGFSSGGALALGLCLHDNALGRPLPMPELVVACSPGAVPMTEAERADMRALSPRDIMVDDAYMEPAGELMRHGRTVPDYMLNGTRGDFTGLPPIHLYYGGDEVLRAMAQPFQAACAARGVDFRLTVGEGLCHCYPLMRYFPEGRQANREIIRLLRG